MTQAELSGRSRPQRRACSLFCSRPIAAFASLLSPESPFCLCATHVCTESFPGRELFAVFAERSFSVDLWRLKMVRVAACAAGLHHCFNVRWPMALTTVLCET